MHDDERPDSASFEPVSSEPAPSEPAEDAGAQHQPPSIDRAQLDRRRLDRIFGVVLPSSTRDDLPEPGRESTATSDNWYYENRPPHYE